MGLIEINETYRDGFIVKTQKQKENGEKTTKLS